MSKPMPPDQLQRMQALDPGRSILVQAPAGSGKTDLLTRRFLRLLAEVNEPGEIVAITFTNAAAAEMRHRILSELEKAAERDLPLNAQRDVFSMEALAALALQRSQTLGWHLIDLPAQLRITTIDAFCRELALQQPLLTGLGGSLEIAPQPRELYRRAAGATLRQIDGNNPTLIHSIEALLRWRDNNWQELESLLMDMLSARDKWMQEFVLDREPAWEALRARLEKPFAKAVSHALDNLQEMLQELPIAEEEILTLARFACATVDDFRALAEVPEMPLPQSSDPEEVDDARLMWKILADFLLTSSGTFRKRPDKNCGFPPDKKSEKERFQRLVEGLNSIDGFESALHAVRALPAARYDEDEWSIIRACFTLLRHAAGELQLVFAESGAVDYTEVAQIAQRVLRAPDGLPTDAALVIADNIHHLLVDEFQDTSRRQHQLLSSLIAAWPEREGRTAFFVGDPMQSIYFFRDADAELFTRVKNLGLELPAVDGLDNEPLTFGFTPLRANFRTEATLVEDNNQLFDSIFACSDGSGISFSSALPMRDPAGNNTARMQLHLEFVPQNARGIAADQPTLDKKDEAISAQQQQIVDLIRSLQPHVKTAHEEDKKFRIAVLARAKSSLVQIAESLRAGQLPFRAVELETLQERPEVLDALALAKALVSPADRVAWLGMLRAPWCGLSLAGLHRLTSNDDPELLIRPVRELMEERIDLLNDEDRAATARVLSVLQSLPALRASLPTITLGSWIEQVWLRMGGQACVDAAGRANLDLLWNSLDSLPHREEDLLGPALDAALRDLMALPDPDASAEHGVQLMTIHKSKGLEFEVVIVPDLQARGSQGDARMLSWLERGLSEPDESELITEFLIAPLQPKGEERGSAKAFVDRSIRERERQEMRRLLYVAATRAREELHFFACPAYKTDTEGEMTLATADGLLATAWSALGAEISARFTAWKADRAQPEAVGAIAASTDNLLTMPGTLIQRLPVDFCATDAASTPGELADNPALQPEDLYERHEGGLVSRALGTAVHELLEHFSKLRIRQDAVSSRAVLSSLLPSIAAQIRARGLSPTEATRIAQQAVQLADAATRNNTGAWILAPHTTASSEAAWSGYIQGKLRSVQADRVFLAGPEPLSEGDSCWWIIDYKTTHAEDEDPDALLPALRERYQKQLAIYADMLRALHGSSIRIRAGLFYPRMGLFDHWPI